MKTDEFFLVTTAAKERSTYHSLAEAEFALKAQLELQAARGCQNERNPSGRYMSKCADLPVLMFWIEDSRGSVLS
jgi:hypothetical protein